MEIKNATIQMEISDILDEIEQVDDIGEVINKIHLMICDLFDGYLGTDPKLYSKSDFSALLVSGYERAQRRAGICLDYVYLAAKKLQDLSEGYHLVRNELHKELAGKDKEKTALEIAVTGLNKDDCLKVLEYTKTLKGDNNEKN